MPTVVTSDPRNWLRVSRVWSACVRVCFFFAKRAWNRKMDKKEINRLRSRRVRKEEKEKKERLKRLEWFVKNIYSNVYEHFEQWDKEIGQTGKNPQALVNNTNHLCGPPPPALEIVDPTPLCMGTDLGDIQPFDEESIFDVKLNGLAPPSETPSVLSTESLPDAFEELHRKDTALEELVALVP